jgi:protoporphyrin/coproporphyrin ferrochelatase
VTGPRSWAVVALNMGGPDSLDAVEPFLRNLLSDPDLVRLPFPISLAQKRFARFVARRRVPKIRHAYELLGGSSPLVCHTTMQARGIASTMTTLGVPAVPFVGMRYWHPFADDVVRDIRSLDPEGIAIVSLYPQFSPATGGSSISDFLRALRAAGLDHVPRVVLDRYPTLPGYVEASADSIRRSLESLGTPRPFVLFSAHGLPQSYVDRGDPYRREIGATYDAIVAALPPEIEHALAFQSRVGPSAWLKPYTPDLIQDLAGRGVRRVLMVPLGFVSDHVETLYEMDDLYGGQARARGIDFHRVPALNDDPKFTHALAAVLAERVLSLSVTCARS